MWQSLPGLLRRYCKLKLACYNYLEVDKENNCNLYNITKFKTHHLTVWVWSLGPLWHTTGGGTIPLAVWRCPLPSLSPLPCCALKSFSCSRRRVWTRSLWRREGMPALAFLSSFVSLSPALLSFLLSLPPFLLPSFPLTLESNLSPYAAPLWLV